MQHRAVARFDLTQLPVVALHRLLRRHQPRLQFSHCVQALTDGHETGVTQAYRRVLHQYFGTTRETLIQLAERRDAFGARVFHHAPHFVATDVTDGFAPRASDPGVHAGFRNSTAESDLSDDAVGGQHQM